MADYHENMTTNNSKESPVSNDGAKSLTGALAQYEHAKDLVSNAAAELSSVNVVLTQELAEKYPLPKVERALDKSRVVEETVQEVADELSAVNRTLQAEVRDRIMLDHRFAAVTEQGEAARHAAFHDPLTGLPNRALFMDRLEHGLAMAQRQNWHLAVMFLDLDSFKEINDTHGHDVGDRVLQTIAQRLKEISRADDTVSRHGGDEFLCRLTKSPDNKTIGAIADKFIQAIQLPCEVTMGDDSISLTINASIGIAVYPKDGRTADALIKSADAAM
ncbi:MAG: GGDEF domain-containing protein, partial [Burkholderiaceae bacterium]